MAYSVNKTDGSLLVSLLDGTANTTSTSLTLIGKNFRGYGESLNENFVKILENFSSNTAPSNPIRGQIWYDSTNSQIKVYNGTSFDVVGPLDTTTPLVVSSSTVSGNSSVGGNLSVTESLDKLFSSAQSGDQDSLDVIQEAAHWFGRGLYNLIVTLDTQCVLVGGSVWRENEALLAPLVQAEISGRFPALTKGVTIQSALLGELVTDIGALTAVMPEPWIEDWRTRKPWQALQSELID